MRDPGRIDPFLAALGDVWKDHPDMRFGQLVMNLSREEDNTFPDTWEWEDDEWVTRMENFPTAEQINKEIDEKVEIAMRLVKEGDIGSALLYLMGGEQKDE